MPKKDCVWSGKALSNKYDVDHVIPFALWKNNDLWNLLPADAAVNNSKRDKLPEYALLSARKDCIIYYWENLRHAFPNRFEYEASKFAGDAIFKNNNWENRLFSSLSEAVEITATQRGITRWQPKVVYSAQASFKKTNVIDKSKSPEIILFPSREDRYVTCVPFYDLKATAGTFDNDQFAETSEIHERWVTVDNMKLEKDMFVIQITGHSMEPKINDGDFCLFRAGSALGGTRQGRTVLVQHRSFSDPDTNTQLTVKNYYSSKQTDDNGNPLHVNVTLKPLNPDYEPISINGVDSEDEFKIIAEFVGVIH
jgi:SOS-response transcriptional repressor LexA